MRSNQETILLIEDDAAVLESTVRILEMEKIGRCLRAPCGQAALALLAEGDPDLILLDLGLPDIPGETLLTQFCRDYPGIPVIVVTALIDVDIAVRCMAQGAYDYVVKGSDPARLLVSARRAIESRRKDLGIASVRERLLSVHLRNAQHFSEIVTRSEGMRVLFRFIEAVATMDDPVLLQGETGTGKELFARAVHKASGTRGPFVASNLGGLDDFVVSDTLFGHLKGAYTGADETRKGLVATASGGTLFLDEIGDLSPPSQVKILRFLENREYFPLGSDQARSSDARVVVATNRDLESLVREGRFRRDLLYRLATYRVTIPPLRDRREDIPLLVAHFQENLSRGAGVPLTPGALDLLREYEFPGNVRELRGILLRAVALANGLPIDKDILTGMLQPGASPGDAETIVPAAGSRFPTIHEAIETLIADAMNRTGGHQAMAAVLLGITPQALSRRLRRAKGFSV